MPAALKYNMKCFKHNKLLYQASDAHFSSNVVSMAAYIYAVVAAKNGRFSTMQEGINVS